MKNIGKYVSTKGVSLAALHFLRTRHIKKESYCSPEVYVMPTDDPQNTTPKNRTATRAPPGDSLIKEVKKDLRYSKCED